MDKKKNVTVCPQTLEEQPPVAEKRMTEAELKHEWQFFRVASLAGRLREAALLSTEEYRLLMAENIKTFSPKLGALIDF